MKYKSIAYSQGINSGSGISYEISARQISLSIYTEIYVLYKSLKHVRNLPYVSKKSPGRRGGENPGNRK